MDDEITKISESFVEDYAVWKERIDSINTRMISDSVAYGIAKDTVKTFSYNEFCVEYIIGLKRYIKNMRKLTDSSLSVIIASMIARRLKTTFREHQYSQNIEDIKRRTHDAID